MSKSDEVERLASVIDDAIARAERLGFSTATVILAMARLEVDQSGLESQATLVPRGPSEKLS